MHGTISQDLCEILPKRLSPAVDQTAQPARDPSSSTPPQRYDDQDQEEARLSSEEVEHRTAFHGLASLDICLSAPSLPAPSLAL